MPVLEVAMAGLLLTQLAGGPVATEGFQARLSISGPLLGYYFDTGRAELRALLGVPGAATVEKLPQIEPSLLDPLVSPRHDYLIGRLPGEEGVAVLRLVADHRALQRIPDVLEQPDGMVLSPAGTAALFLLQRGDSTSSRWFAGSPGCGCELQHSWCRLTRYGSGNQR